jgi:hypothetical protein
MTTEITIFVDGASTERHCSFESAELMIAQDLLEDNYMIHNLIREAAPNLVFNIEKFEVKSVSTDFATEEQTKEHGCMFWFTAECTVTLSVSGGEQ